MSASYEKRKSSLCRLCLQELENGMDIFTCRHKKRLPAKMIAELLQAGVSKDDEYPQQICNECFRKLKTFYELNRRFDMSTFPEFVLFREHCQIAKSTIEYIRDQDKAESDGQHTPVSMDHSPLNLNLEELGMEDNEEADKKQDQCNLLEAVAGILKSIRCKQTTLVPGKAKEFVSESSFPLNTDTGEEDFPRLYIESSDDCSDKEQTVTPIREDISENIAEEGRNHFHPTGLENAHPNIVESKSEEHRSQEECRKKSKSSSTRTKTPRKHKKSSFDDLKRHRIPKRKKPKIEPCSSPITTSSDTKSSIKPESCTLDSSGDQQSRANRYKLRSNVTNGSTVQLQRKKNKWNKNRRSLSTEKQHECDLCGRMFVLLLDLEKHLKLMHFEPIRTNCETPRATNVANSETPKIGKVRIKEELLKTDDPQSSFKVSNERWESSVTSNLPNQFICEGCGSKFDKVGHLEIHLIQHFDKVNLLCNICGIKFSEYRYMKRHFIRHLGLKRFHCSQCDKHFDNRTNLKLHEMVHSDEKPFICPHCGKAFGKTSLLKFHQMTHDRIKPVKCGNCNLSFAQRSDLTKHMVVHTRERKFACPTCGKRFLHKRNLSQHERLHDKKKWYNCDFCGKSYTQLRALAYHINNLCSKDGKKNNNRKGHTKKSDKHKLKVVIKYKQKEKDGKKNNKRKDRKKKSDKHKLKVVIK